MTKKIMQAILIVASVVLLLSFILVAGLFYNNYAKNQTLQLEDELNIAAQGVELSGLDYLSALASTQSERYRLTWIANDGTVLFDNTTDAGQMENHADRTEFQEALEAGSSQSTRYSSTQLEIIVYHAKRLSDGSVLRIATSRSSIVKIAINMILPLLLVFALSWVLSLLLAKHRSQKIVQPLNSLDLDNPLENDIYPELSPLLRRIYTQRKELDSQLQALKRHSDEFDQISRSMSEGLMVLALDGKIVSINRAALEMFKYDGNFIGRSFLEMERNHEFSVAIENALANGHDEIRLERNGRVYRFSMSRITSEGQSIGLVVLAFDITESANAESMRREFSANVSHELKTPLQGIIGSAELIESGMAKDQNAIRFASHIHIEASRMVTLIEDIIRLSQLDEGIELSFDQPDILCIATEVQSELSESASKKNITIEVSGTHTQAKCVTRLIHEMIYNLVDNGIKYNNEGGKVSVLVSSTLDSGLVKIVVKDNGIGIPPEHLDRIFERFYRVDKSHSKASGGTGLGLSIVKHAVMYHHGKISVDSQVGQGTTFTVEI
jgi:two-component system, OmpR family, phosphate regulon sensor histidine kinase PhoR